MLIDMICKTFSMQSKLFIFLTLFSYNITWAQSIDKIINPTEVKRIESILSDDKMEGRKTFTAGNTRAADFIAREFESIGLDKFNNAKSFKQEFAMTDVKMVSAKGTIDNQPLKEENIVAITMNPLVAFTEKSGFEVANIRPGDNISKKITGFISDKKNYVVFVDTSFAGRFSRLNQFNRQFNKSDKSVVLILVGKVPIVYDISVVSNITSKPLANVVGVLPGKSRKNEYVVFSGHYDHLGIGKPVDGDSIFNGANDDAAGTTAVIMLAKYFKSLGQQERTLIFATFTAEEIGGYGSQYFSRQLNPDEVVAMFNIEMIGTDSKWGNNAAYITGYEKSDLGKILDKNLEGSGFKFYPDPYTDQNLFYRSDNATLARLGVPAHTISTSKMDSEKNYHTVKDEIGTLDMNNMAMIIKAIALSSTSIINGKDTPSRVDVQQLK
jgi:hypothetical protein